MKKFLAASTLIIAVFAVQIAWADVAFESSNHAVFGGLVRVEGRVAEQKCSARFDTMGVEKFSSWGIMYFDS